MKYKFKILVSVSVEQISLPIQEICLKPNFVCKDENPGHAVRKLMVMWQDVSLFKTKKSWSLNTLLRRLFTTLQPKELNSNNQISNNMLLHVATLSAPGTGNLDSEVKTNKLY